MKFYEAVKARRSRYDLTKDSVITDQRIKEILSELVTYTPSAFHSQTSRVVLLLNEEHDKLWNIVRNTLKKIVPEDKFEPTEKKIQSFENTHGTILYFEDMQVVEKLQKQFPGYADNFPVWSMQSAGMLQFAIWTALSSEGLGASIQHYNPIIDDEVKEVFDIPSTWKLIAQMPFGNPKSEPDQLEYQTIEERLFVKGEKHD